jgi:AraC-like DNA-binding protein
MRINGHFLLNGRERKAIENALMYIEKNSNKNISSCDLANKFCISSLTLSHGIKLLTGTSLQNYQEQIRFQKADELLLYTNKSIKEISITVGFKSTSHFCKKYKFHRGITPGQSRIKMA